MNYKIFDKNKNSKMKKSKKEKESIQEEDIEYLIKNATTIEKKKELVLKINNFDKISPKIKKEKLAKLNNLIKKQNTLIENENALEEINKNALEEIKKDRDFVKKEGKTKYQKLIDELNKRKIKELNKKYEIYINNSSIYSLDKYFNSTTEINKKYEKLIYKVKEKCENSCFKQSFVKYINLSGETSPDDIDIVNNALEKENFNEFISIATKVSVAYSEKENKNKFRNQIVEFNYNKEGYVLLDKNINQDVLEKDFAKKNEKINLQIDKDNIDYEKNKNNINEIPIRILNKNNILIGYVHTISWIKSRNYLIDNPELDLTQKKDLINKTKEIRNYFFENGKNVKNITIKGKILDKSAGWLNINKNKIISINEAFGKDKNVLLRTICSLGPKNAEGIDIANEGLVTNPRLKGKIVALIPGANGQHIATLLKQKTLNISNKKNEIIHNVLGILLNAVKDKDIDRKKINDELRKYIYNQCHFTKELKKNWKYIINKNLLFNVDLSDNKKCLTFSIIYKEIPDNFISYKISNKNKEAIVQEIIPVINGIKLSPPIPYNKIETILLDALGNKYINFDNNSSLNEEKFSRMVADKDYNITKKKNIIEISYQNLKL